jgi:CRP-like cAMP-binding protein
VGLGAGSVVHRETDADRWSYVLLDGTVAVSQNGDPLAVAAPGTWFPLGPVHGKATRARISLTAMTDVELLAFRWQELVALAKDIPALVAV